MKKKTIIGAVGAAITAGTLLFAPPALADAGVPRDVTEDVTEDGPFPGLLQFPVDFPRLTHEPRYEPRGASLGIREVRSVHSAYSIPASNPTA